MQDSQDPISKAGGVYPPTQDAVHPTEQRGEGRKVARAVKDVSSGPTAALRPGSGLRSPSDAGKWLSLSKLRCPICKAELMGVASWLLMRALLANTCKALRTVLGTW